MSHVRSRIAAICYALALGTMFAAPSAFAQAKASGKLRSAAPTSAPDATLTLVTSVEGITEYRMANGLRVLLFPDASKPTATVNVTYLVGSGSEGYGETGMAHLLEHMVFKGTPNHRNVPQELTEHGTRPNGSTWFDRTNYFETFPATDENLAWALDLEADRMVNSFIAKKDLDSEMTVVRNEFEAGENNPTWVLLQRMLASAYQVHNYRHTAIGARSDIENVPIERLQAFYHKFYQPDNAVLLVAGKFDEGRVKQLIGAKFGRLHRPTRVLDKFYTSEPTQDGERAVTLRRVGDDQVVAAMYHVPPGAHLDFAAVDVLTRIMGESPSGRLYKALVNTKKAASVDAQNFQLRDAGTVFFLAQLRKGENADGARAELINTVEDAAVTPATAEEVERARANLLKDFQLTLNNTERIGLELSEWASMGDWRLFFLHRDRIKSVTPADIQRVAATYLKTSNRTLGVFVPTPNPDRSEIPAGPDVAALVRDYKGDAAVAAGEVFDASPANIDARTQRTTLPSGLKLLLLPKKTRGQSVNATLMLRYGTEQSLTGQEAALEAVAGMLLRGTRSKSRQQIKDELDRLKAQVSIEGGGPQQPNFTRVRIETTRADFPATLRLVSEVLTQPAFDSTEFAKFKAEQLAQIEARRSEPAVVGSIAFSKALNGLSAGHPRYFPSIDESVALLTALSAAEIKRAYDALYGAGSGELAVVGDFDSTETTKIANEFFGRWKSPSPVMPLLGAYHATTAQTLSFETPDKANAFFLAGEMMKLQDTDPDYPALLLANYMLGGGFLNSRLATRIRQKDGLSYGVGSQFSASPLEPSAMFAGFAIYAPQNAERLEAAFREELDRAEKEGFTADEVAKAKQGYLQTRQLARSQDASLATQLSAAAYLNRTLAFDAAIDRRIAEVTAEQVTTALRKYVDLKSLLVVRAGDFKRVKASGEKPSMPSPTTPAQKP
ncbi:MAG: pitrilysin family protein [Gemmatimonadaceae bacterium]